MPLKLELSIEQINLVLYALAKLPYEQSADMIQLVRNQVQPQLPIAQAPEPAGGTD